MSGSNKTTSAENFICESNELYVEEETSSTDEFRDEFLPDIRLSEAPLFIHDTEIEIKYEDVDYNNIIAPVLDSEADYDLDFETISKTRAELSTTAIHIQSEGDESIVKMECLQKEEVKSDSEADPDFELSGSESDPDYSPTSPPTHLTRSMHRQSLPKNNASNDSARLKAQKRGNHMKGSKRGKSLTTKAHLTVHMRTHTGESLYTCEQCERSFSSKGNLTRHKIIHTGEKPYQCTVCDKQFTRSANLTVHNRIHTGEKPYECPMCQKHFKHLTSLSRHVRFHTGEKPHQCDRCEKRFTLSTDLTTHKRVHTGERPYKCKECEKSFSQKSTLITHMIIHTGEKPFKCDMCHKCLTTLGALNVHVKRQHAGERPARM